MSVVTRRVTIIVNPARKPLAEISDRAKRYRANERENIPPGPKQCGFCGRRRNVGVHHITGDENDGDKNNLMWACKSCNGSIAARMKRAGVGRRTVQYNPPRGSRKDSMKAYGDAIKVMRGVFEGDVGKAVATIRATPRALRSSFTSRSWPVRRQLYGPSGRQGRLFDDVPF
jgi:hypothetical protein